MKQDSQFHYHQPFPQPGEEEINEVFTQTVSSLFQRLHQPECGIYGTKLNPANKYTFVWRKTVERNRERLMKKIHVLLGQIDDVIAREKSSENNEEVEFTPAMLTEMAGELRHALEQVSEPSAKEEKTELKETQTAEGTQRTQGQTAGIRLPSGTLQERNSIPRRTRTLLL